MEIKWPPRWFRLTPYVLAGVTVVTLVVVGLLNADFPSSPPNLSVPGGRDTLKELIQGGRFSTITLSGISLEIGRAHV